MRKMTFYTGGFTCLEVLPKSQKPCARAHLLADGNKCEKTAYCHRLHFPVQPDAHVTLELSDCEAGFVYLCGGERPLESGICVLWPKTNKNSPYRELFHFTPPVGWLNDPNGLCFNGGYFHLYYQFYPHAESWGNMHWGHATSRDLFHWTHQPVFLLPQQSLLEDDSLAGGAFSGSAVCEEDQVSFFFTRHTARRGVESSMVETQCVTTSPDGMAPGEELVIVENDNSAFSYHFRDPKVFREGESWYMVLGSCVEGVPSILLYCSPDLAVWRYLHPLLQESGQICESIECPDFFALDGGYVAVGALMNHTDSCGRKNPVKYYLGEFLNERLSVSAQGLYDFGGSFYAVQSFLFEGRRIAIGWIADFYNEHIEANGGTCGSMSLPRELHVRGSRLYMRPVESVYEQKGALIYDGAGENIALGGIPGNAYYAELLTEKGAPFTLILAQDTENRLSFTTMNGPPRIESTRLPNVSFCAQEIVAEKVEVFFDRRTAEIFLNDGEAAGAKTFYCGGDTGSFKLCAAHPSQIKRVRVYEMGFN